MEEIEEKFKNDLLWMILPEDRPLVFQSLKEQLLIDDYVEIIFRIRNKSGRAVFTLSKFAV